ncbi:F-box protein CPR1 [Linum grandiflorum]
MSDVIPEEIMVDILLRLRVKDLVNCRRVSKQWLSIIDDPDFVHRQLHGSLSTNSILFLQDRVSAKVFYWKQQSHDDIGSSFFLSDPTEYEPTQKLQLIGSCHSFVCFSILNHSPSPDFLILNPSTGERHQLTSNPSKEGDELKAYGFGYDELSDDYKVVRILQTERSGDYDDPHIAEIYGVRSNCFYRIPLPFADWTNNYFTNLMGVIYGSSLHWCNLNTNVRKYVIHTIDIVSNTYRKLHLPLTTFGNHYWIRIFNLSVVDGCLCLLALRSDERKIGIWVMEEYGNSESWNRICCIPQDVVQQSTSCPYAVTYLGHNGDKILLMIDWHMVVLYDRAKKNVDETKLVTFTDLWRVSKQLLSIIDDAHFIRSQRELAHSTNSNCALFIHDKATCYLRVAMRKHKYDDINSFFSTQLANYELATESLLIGSCHGLVCFSSNQPDSLDFLVINPSTGERHTLANPSKDARRTTHDHERLRAYGFGYDKLSDDYKIVRILQTWSDDRHIEQSAFSAEIYSVRSKGFLRTIPLRDSDWIGFLFINSMGVFSNSALHWCTWNSYIEEYVIHAIDIVSDT